MKQFVTVALMTLGLLVVLAPTARGGPRPEGDETSYDRAKKGGSCKDACFHAEATCRGKRGACMAARQRCMKGCR